MGFFAQKFGKFSGGFSSGILSVSLSGGSWGTGLTLSQDITVPLSDAFKWINSKLPAVAAPIEGPVEAVVVAAIKNVSVTF